MFKNPLLIIALVLTGLVAVWGIIDTTGLTAFASLMTGILFTSRGWFVMLSVSFLLILSISMPSRALSVWRPYPLFSSCFWWWSAC